MAVLSRHSSILDNPVDREILSQLQAISQKHVEQLEIDHTEQGTVKIFNIGPLSHKSGQGGLGEFLVPKCPENRAYSKPLEIWKQFPEGRGTDDMHKIALRLLDGHAIAEAIVSCGKFCDPSSDLRKWGVFVCGLYTRIGVPGEEPADILTSEVPKFQRDNHRKGKIIQTREATAVAIQAARRNGDGREEEEIAADILGANLPSEAELDDAQDRLNKFCLELVEEGNGFYKNGEMKEINGIHRWAAKYTANLGLDWVKPSVLKMACHICRNSIPVDVAICTNCKTIMPGKEEIVRQARVPGYEWLWSPAHPDYQGSSAAPEAEEEEPVTPRSRKTTKSKGQ
jgi:hypothetical protein